MTTTDNRPAQNAADTHCPGGEPVSTSLQAIARSLPIPGTPAGDQPASSQKAADAKPPGAAGSNFPADQGRNDTQWSAVGGEQTEDGSAATTPVAPPNELSSLADPFLALAADVLNDTEATKNANENRLRQLTRTAVDSDGEERGFGLDESHPDVAQLAALVELLGQVEHQAVLQLQRKMRKHPLGPWVKAQKGVGDKQAARLLAVIGDPYWNTLHDRPRTVSELTAYCGLHVVAGIAARRRKGQKANWSTSAKTRAYLIAESMLRAGNRTTYDARKAATEGRTHAEPCAQCGPKGKPAQPGSPWSDGHRHADALRITSKELLKGLWREARRLHEGER